MPYCINATHLPSDAAIGGSVGSSTWDGDHALASVPSFDANGC